MADVLAAQNVSFAGVPSFCRQHVAQAERLGVYPVEPAGRREPGKPAPDLADDAAADEMDVAGTDDAGGIDDDGVQPVCDRLPHRLLGQVLRVAVGEAVRREVEGGRFVEELAWWRHPQRADRTGVDQPLDPGRQCGRQHVARALDVDPVDPLGRGTPVVGDGGDVEDERAALAGCHQRRRVQDVPDHQLGVEAVQRVERGGGATHRPHVVTSRQQCRHDVRPDAAGRARHECLECHSCNSSGDRGYARQRLLCAPGGKLRYVSVAVARSE